MAPKAREKPKASPASQPAIAIEDLFTTLKRHIQRSEYDQAAKVADQVLSIAPNDEDAIRCKIVALIKAYSIDEALSAIESSRRLPIDFSLFKLQKSKLESLEINLVAALISAGRASEVQGVMETLRVKATSSFELAYNTACSLIEKNKYTDPEQLLLSARRIGQETLMEDNLADDYIEIKLAPITVQLAHVQQLVGHTQEAIEAYTNIIKRNLADGPSLAVAINNLVSLNGPKDVSDSLRKLDRLIERGSGPQSFQLAHGLDLELSPKHREVIYTNQVLLLLHSHKMDQARELVAVLGDMFPGSVMPLLLQAALLVRENKAGRAEEILGQVVEKFPDKSKIVLLARAQIAAAAGHPQVAAESLAKIADVQHTVATLVSLKERAGDLESAVAVFDSAIEWWSNAMAEDNKLNVLMQEAATFKLKQGRKEEAAKLYEELVKGHGSIEALVGLIRTSAYTDIEKAEAYEKQLKPLPGLKAIDIDSLEKTSGAKHVENGPCAGITEPMEAKSKEKAKRKRKRKPRYPKGFDPANPGPPPDSERWLPKRERSSYRPKRKDKRAAHVRGSQGAVAKEAANTSAKSSQTTNTKAASQNTVADQPKPSSKSSRKKSRN